MSPYGLCSALCSTHPPPPPFPLAAAAFDRPPFPSSTLPRLTLAAQRAFQMLIVTVLQSRHPLPRLSLVAAALVTRETTGKPPTTTDRCTTSGGRAALRGQKREAAPSCWRQPPRRWSLRRGWQVWRRSLRGGRRVWRRSPNATATPRGALVAVALLAAACALNGDRGEAEAVSEECALV